ncbi:MAG: hypothetical protein MJ197_09760 [Bacteroidales bacterium]|nr:hypothetical protein [Bacteroidales bacterium]
MTVWEMYQKTKQAQTPLLSNFTGDFWVEYLTNYTIIDRIFATRYKTFKYFLDEDFTDDTTEVTDFIQSVYDLLFVNSKKYHEMWRIQEIDDADLSMTYNYDMTETNHATTNMQGANKDGQHTDVRDFTTGEQSFVGANKSTAMNSATEKLTDSNTNVNGSRNDIESTTFGEVSSTMQTSSTNEYTLTRKGNIGTETGADILKKFDSTFALGVFQFYDRVFDDISKHLLLVGD